jgi:hypothetical protein
MSHARHIRRTKSASHECRQRCHASLRASATHAVGGGKDAHPALVPTRGAGDPTRSLLLGCLPRPPRSIATCSPAAHLPERRPTRPSPGLGRRVQGPCPHQLKRRTVQRHARPLALREHLQRRGPHRLLRRDSASPSPRRCARPSPGHPPRSRSACCILPAQRRRLRCRCPRPRPCPCQPAAGPRGSAQAYIHVRVRPGKAPIMMSPLPFANTRTQDHTALARLYRSDVLAGPRRRLRLERAPVVGLHEAELALQHLHDGRLRLRLAPGLF